MRNRASLCALLTLTCVACTTPPATNDSIYEVRASSAVAAHRGKITRDARGVPHIKAQSLAEAFWLLGYATFEDRAFQIFYRRAHARGRLAEFFAKPNPTQDATISAFNQRLIDADRWIRTVGYGRSADAKAPNLPGDIPRLLQAYADGVNAKARVTNLASLHAFDVAGITTFEKWTPADSLLAWDWVGIVFAGHDIADEIKNMLDCEDSNGCTIRACSPPLDEAVANVPVPSDGQWPPAGVELGALLQGDDYRPPPAMKASHGAAVAGTHTSDGKPFLFGEPQLEVFAPSTWYEYGIEVPGLAARGASFAGAPGMVVFWNEHVSQTVTAGGRNLFDLVELAPGSSADKYRVNNVDLTLTRRNETILVRGGAPVVESVAISAYGPIANPFLPQASLLGARRFAVERAEDLTKTSHSVVAAINIMRADSLKSYHKALSDWFSPAVNGIYAGVDADDPTSHGHIAYHSLGALVDRVRQVRQGRDYTGRYPIDGSQTANNWKRLLDSDWVPHVYDPRSGYIVNGNSSPVGAWYDRFVPGAGLAGVGDTYRSFELRTQIVSLLDEGGGIVDPEQLHALHFNDHFTGGELFTQLLEYVAVHFPDRVERALPGQAAPTSAAQKAGATLTALTAWMRSGGRAHATDPSYALIANLGGELIRQSRSGLHPITACRYNAGEGGALHLLKTVTASPETTVDSAVVDFAVDSAVAVWDRMLLTYPSTSTDPYTWQARDPITIANRYQVNWVCLHPGSESTCSLDPALEVPLTGDAFHVNTINSANGSSYAMSVLFGDLDHSRSLLPPGVSEEPSSPYFRNMLPNVEAKSFGDLESIPVSPLHFD